MVGAGGYVLPGESMLVNSGGVHGAISPCCFVSGFPSPCLASTSRPLRRPRPLLTHAAPSVLKPRTRQPCFPSYSIVQETGGDERRAALDVMPVQLQQLLLTVEVMSKSLGPDVLLLQGEEDGEDDDEGSIRSEDGSTGGGGESSFDDIEEEGEDDEDVNDADDGGMVREDDGMGDGEISPRQRGLIYSELQRRRLEMIRKTEAGRVDMTTSSLRERQAAKRGSSGAGSSSSGGGGSGADPLRNKPDFLEAVVVGDEGNGPQEGEKGVGYYILRSRLLGPIRIRYHFSSGAMEVADIPWLERSHLYQRQHPVARFFVRLARPIYAPALYVKRLRLVTAIYYRAMRRNILVAPSWGWFSLNFYRGMYACLICIFIGLLLDEGAFFIIRTVLSWLTGGKYAVPEMRVLRIYFPGQEAIL